MYLSAVHLKLRQAMLGTQSVPPTYAMDYYIQHSTDVWKNQTDSTDISLCYHDRQPFS